MSNMKLLLLAIAALLLLLSACTSPRYTFSHGENVRLYRLHQRQLHVQRKLRQAGVKPTYPASQARRRP